MWKRRDTDRNQLLNYKKNIHKKVYKNTQQNKAKLDADSDKKSAIFMPKNN